MLLALRRYEHLLLNRNNDLFEVKLVVAYPPQFVADPRCILLSQSYGNIEYECL